MQINKKTFCVAPWFQIRNNNDLSKKVCCGIKPFKEDKDSKDLKPLEYLNSAHILDLKKKLMEGHKPDVCSSCWQDESNQITSLRQTLNGVVTLGKFDGPTWMDAYFKRKKNYKTDSILMADVKMGNTCNHACVMCNPNDSSLIYNDWIQRKDSEFVQEHLDIDPKYFENVKFNGYKNKKYREYIQEILINNKNLKFLKMLGGEPLLDKKLLTTLKNMDKKIKDNLQLDFVTNGSIDIQSVLKYIGRFKYINCTVSVEGIGPVHEYARAGSSWKFVEKNILKTLENNNCGLSIQHTLQTATILGFESLLKWCQSHSIEIGCGLVERPDYLSISSLPTKIKEEIIEKINPYRSIFSDVVDADGFSLSYKNLIMKIKDIKYDPILNDKFFRYIDWYQKGKEIPNLRTIFPELYEQNNY